MFSRFTCLPTRVVFASIHLWGVVNATNDGNFTIVGGQIYTPGLAILDSPQPFTPEGGDFLQVALDISGDGRLPQPPDNADPLTQIFNITLFLTSYSTQKNFTVSNGTTALPPLADIMAQEPGSTVKHVNFEWPDCLTGNGQDTSGTARGDYNISIHQNFRLNGSNFYTIFNLPIMVTNEIAAFPPATQLLVKPIPGPVSSNGGRVACAVLENRLQSDVEQLASVNNPPFQPYLGGEVSISGTGGNGGNGGGGGGNGGGGTVGNPGQNGNGGTKSGNGDGQGVIGNIGSTQKPRLGVLVLASGVAVWAGALDRTVHW